MHSVTLQKYPPQTDNSVVRDGTRAYIRYYGLLAERLKWVVESDSATIPTDVRRYIARLTDPLAFQAGEVETVEAIEDQLDTIFDTDKSWTGEPFKIKTVIKDTGSHGGLLSRSSKATLYTFGGCGDRAGRLDQTHIPIASNGSVRDRKQLNDWNDEFDELYANPQDGDVFEVRFEPSEGGLFAVAFTFERGN